MVLFSAPSRPRRPALALSAFPDTLSRLYRVPRACWAGSRRATSHAGSSRAASSKTRAERRRAWRARPHARGRRQGRRASWRLCQARACRKTPRSARDVTEAARLGAARAAGRRRHQARGRRAPPNRQGRRGSREHSTRHTVFLARVSYRLTSSTPQCPNPHFLSRGGKTLRKSNPGVLLGLRGPTDPSWSPEIKLFAGPGSCRP